MSEEAKEPQNELDNEYFRILENADIYFDEIGSLDTLERFTSRLAIILYVLTLVFLITLVPSEAAPLDAIISHHWRTNLTLIFFCLFFLFFFLKLFYSRKISQITSDLGLSMDERLFLRTYETRRDINSYLEEKNMKRKSYFRLSALENLEETIGIVSGWTYGNIGFVRILVGDQIDLLKDNMKRLVLPNVAKGDESALRKISKAFAVLCEYILSPSTESLAELNTMIGELPYKEYKVLTRKERVQSYLHGKPRFCRLVFASTVTVIIAVITFWAGLGVEIILAIAIPCFWGAFAGFDKIFKPKGQ